MENKKHARDIPTENARKGGDMRMHMANEECVDDKHSVDLCVICAEPVVHFAVGNCHHPEELVCSMCCLRIRLLLKVGGI